MEFILFMLAVFVGSFVLALIRWIYKEVKEAPRRARQEQEAKERRAAETRSCEKSQSERRMLRKRLTASVITAKTPHIHGVKTQRQLGAVHSKWHRDQADALSSDYYSPDCRCRGTHGDAAEMTMCDLVELTLRQKAHDLGANAIVNLRIHSFNNGCEGSGDAIVVVDQLVSEQ